MTNSQRTLCEIDVQTVNIQFISSYFGLNLLLYFMVW